MDKTFLAVSKQLKAFAVDIFEVGLYSRCEDKMLPRTWNTQELLVAIPWLKRMNLDGHDIYIRPQGSQGLIFFDDLNQSKVDCLIVDGLRPALLLESSPMNFHGWLRVSENSIEEGVSTLLCKNIAVKYGGDKDSADWRHYGRLAGFTNQKPGYVDETGKRPFVLLRSSWGKVCPKGPEMLIRAQTIFESRKEDQKPKRRLIAVSHGLGDIIPFYNSELLSLEARYGEAMDASRADWMIVKKMIALGYSREQLNEAMLQCSPALKRRGSHAENYIALTLDKAFKRAEGEKL